MSLIQNAVVYAVYDRTNAGKGIKPVSLHFTEAGANAVVAKRREGLEDYAKKYIQYEPFEVNP